MYDTVIHNGSIIDGSERKAYVADVAVKDGRIAGIGRYAKEDARDWIDAAGQVVCPGFIDTHVHSDVELLWDRQHASALYQGVTTEVLGQDGLSYAPLSKANLDMYFQYLAGLNGNPDIALDWSSVMAFRRKFDGKAAVNTVYQVPHGALRLETVGFRDVPLVGGDLAKAKEILALALDEGAAALSTGLSYYPGSYCDTQELIELAQVVAEKNSVYVTHLRTVFKGPAFDPVGEALEIGRKAACAVHFSHFRTNAGSAGKVPELMHDIDEAYQAGMDVSLELYPYTFFSSTGVIYLPPWAVEGGYSATLERLSDPGLRDDIAAGIEQDIHFKSGGILSYLPSGKNNDLLGKTFQEAAALRDQPISRLLCELLLDERLAIGICGESAKDPAIEAQIERDFLELLSRPYYMVGSDAIFLGDNPHPRAFGTFPKLLRLSRENAFPLEKMINRMTLVPAKRFGLHDRGEIAAGKAADIVVFDPQTVTDTATLQKSRSAPVGITHVWVNGKPAVRNEKVTGIFAGRALPLIQGR